MRNVLSTFTGYPFDSSRFTTENNGRTPLIRIRDVLRGKTITYTDEKCPIEYVIHKGDILVGMDGDFNIGKWKSNNGFLNQRVCKIVPFEALVIKDYIYFYLPIQLKQIHSETSSVTVKHLSNKQIENILFPMPPYSEQIRITNKINSMLHELEMIEAALK